MLDICCHLIFNVDHGPDTLGESIMMMHLAYESGTRLMVATPKVQRAAEREEAENWNQIQLNYQELLTYAAVSLPQLKLLLGATILVTKRDCSEGVYLWHGRSSYGINGSHWSLIEFSEDLTYQEMGEAVEDLIKCGQKPIIAHVESYPCLRWDLQQFATDWRDGGVKHLFSLSTSRLADLKNKGAFIQVSSGAINGMSDAATRKWVLKAIELELVDFVASGANSAIINKPVLSGAFQQISKQYGALVAYRLFEDHPSRMLDQSMNHVPYTPKNKGRQWVAVAALLLAFGLGGQSLAAFMDQKRNSEVPLLAATPASVESVISDESVSTSAALSQAGEIELVEETVALGVPVVEGNSAQTHDQGLSREASMKQVMDQFQLTFKNAMNHYDSMATLLESEAKALSKDAKSKEEQEVIISKYNKRIGDLEAETDRLFVQLIEELEIKLKENKLSLAPINEAREVYSSLKKEHRSSLVD